jgi:SPP1 gp7 family putative phage head morphogenesis protein
MSTEKKADDALGKSALSKSHLETVYRTNLMLGYGTGQKWAVQQRLLKTEFPYLDYSATHDGRTRPEHLAMESHGIGGTSIYRVDDPVIQTFWPGCWDYNCRCVGTFLTLRQAAKRGIEEARLWLETGKPPEQPAFVAWPAFSPPPGFPVF